MDLQIWLIVLEDVKMQIRRAPIVEFMDLTGILNFWFEPDFPENNSFWTKQIRCQTQIEISLVNFCCLMNILMYPSDWKLQQQMISTVQPTE